MKIKDIKNPNFLKNLNIKELENLSSDIRNYILENVSNNGGHLSSNLGIVDLTIALLKVFDVNNDKFIFDVGHQTYAYKILTGRAYNFNSLRKKDGLSGFQSIKESEFDIYEAGHSSTSLSAGLGFALSRDMNNKNYNVISIIGDGSISNGLANEALNHIGDLQTKQIIIINDNQMSISKNVGAIHNMLDRIRGSKGYRNTKENTKNILRKNKIGLCIFSFINSIKSNLKKIYLKNGSYFNDLGFQYYGPINGHDYKELIKYLEIAKRETKPVILHVITQKGKGYDFAENDKIGKYHGIGPFNIENGNLKNNINLPSYSEIISSYVYNYARKDKNIICITPGMSYGSKLDTIKEKIPKQYIDTGITEEHSLILANSLAVNGKKPIVFIYSTFLQRGYDQIVHDIARMNSNVIICVDRAGLVPEDGVSHQGLFDIPMLLSIPNMVICSPSEASEANSLLNTALNYNGPFVIRYPKDNLKYDYNLPKEIKVGSWKVLTDGEDGFIVTYGRFVNNALEINKLLKSYSIDLTVINARFIKPIDEKIFKAMLKTNKPIFVYEESMEIGSLGSFLATYMQSVDSQSKLTIIGVKDVFLEHASYDELLQITKLDIDSVTNKILEYYKK